MKFNKENDILVFKDYNMKIFVKIDKEQVVEILKIDIFNKIFWNQNNFEYLPISFKLILEEKQEKIFFEMIDFDIGLIDEWKNILEDVKYTWKWWFCDQSSDQIYNLSILKENLQIETYDYELYNSWIEKTKKVIQIVNFDNFLNIFNKIYKLNENIRKKILENKDNYYVDYIMNFISIDFRVNSK